MAGKTTYRNPVPVSDLVAGILDPVLRRRTGMSVGLVQSWEEIVGPHLARASRPQRIQWPRRLHDEDPFQPAVLIVACQGAAALYLQHETGEVIARVNAFLGYPAIGRIRIVQKPVEVASDRDRPHPGILTEAERIRIAGTVRAIEDSGLRESLQRLGETVLGNRASKR
jgi:hypothetical protein